jgi:hypothetical protein
MLRLSDLKNALRRVAEGGELSGAELQSLYPPDKSEFEETILNAATGDAWHVLSHFVADADIRARDKNYDRLQREEVRSRLEQIEALERSDDAQRPRPARLPWYRRWLRRLMITR